MKKYIRRNDTVSGKLNDEMVMMDLNKGKYFSLNPVATAIWELLENPSTIDELCQLLMNEYEVEHSKCNAEVTEHIGEMMKLGLIMEN